MLNNPQYTVPIGKEANNLRAREDTAYIQALDPGNGPRDIVAALADILPHGASVFEYWAGPWRNLFYLAEKGYEVSGQDISDEMIRIFQQHAMEKNMDIDIHDCPAQEYVPVKMHEAFVCTYVLHFLLKDDALKVISVMQENTCSGWYNAVTLFSSENSRIWPDCFYALPEEMKKLYANWKICQENIWESGNAQKHDAFNTTFLFQKTL